MFLAYFVHHPHPFIWQFSEDWGIRYYGFAYILGFLAAYFGFKQFRKWGWSRLSDDQIGDLMMWSVGGVLIGGRLGYCLFYDWDQTVSDPVSIVAFWRDGGFRGMASHGGVIGVMLATFLYCRKNGLQFLEVIDNLAVFTPIGLGLGRIANFLNGELWGRTTDVPWAFYFGGAPGSLPRHPSQLYEAFGEGLLLFVLMLLIRRKNYRAGTVASWFLISYGIIRTFVECFREPDVQIGLKFGFLTQGQLFSTVMILGGLGLLFWIRKTSKEIKRA
jgi:phosphatidylglycerol:prolipoprotein diacylglycerol transferase